MAESEVERSELTSLSDKLDELGALELKKECAKWKLDNRGRKEDLYERLKSFIGKVLECDRSDGTKKGCNCGLQRELELLKIIIEEKDKLLAEKDILLGERQNRVSDQVEINLLLREKLNPFINEDKKCATPTPGTNNSAAAQQGKQLHTSKAARVSTSGAKTRMESHQKDSKNEEHPKVHEEKATFAKIMSMFENSDLQNVSKPSQEETVPGAVPSDGFKEVKKKKQKTYKPIIGTNAAGGSLMAAEKKIYLHVWRLREGTSCQDVARHLESKIPGIGIECEALKARGSYSSFKVTAGREHLEIIQNPDTWPEGTAINRFFHRRATHHKAP